MFKFTGQGDDVDDQHGALCTNMRKPHPHASSSSYWSMPFISEAV
jgi:hypothetical protein